MIYKLCYFPGSFIIGLSCASLLRGPWGSSSKEKFRGVRFITVIYFGIGEIYYNCILG